MFLTTEEDSSTRRIPDGVFQPGEAGIGLPPPPEPAGGMRWGNGQGRGLTIPELSTLDTEADTSTNHDTSTYIYQGTGTWAGPTTSSLDRELYTNQLGELNQTPENEDDEGLYAYLLQ